MKTVKTTLIVLATLFGVGLVLFLGSALVAGISRGNKERRDQADRLTMQLKQDSIQTQLDSLSKIYAGKIVTIDKGPLFACAVDRLPTGGEQDIGYFENGQKVQVLAFENQYKKVKVAGKALTGYINYYCIKEFRRVADRDTVLPDTARLKP